MELRQWYAWRDVRRFGHCRALPAGSRASGDASRPQIRLHAPGLRSLWTKPLEWMKEIAWCSWQK